MEEKKKQKAIIQVTKDKNKFRKTKPITKITS